VNNSCGYKLLSEIKKTNHAFIHDKIDTTICNAWDSVDAKLTTITTPKMPNAFNESDWVKCVSQRPFFTEKSTFKIGVGDVITWRAGYNHWAKTSDK